MACRVGQRTMEGDDVCCSDQLIERHIFCRTFLYNENQQHKKVREGKAHQQERVVFDYDRQSGTLEHPAFVARAEMAVRHSVVKFEYLELPNLSNRAHADNADGKIPHIRSGLQPSSPLATTDDSLCLRRGSHCLENELDSGDGSGVGYGNGSVGVCDAVRTEIRCIDCEER